MHSDCQIQTLPIPMESHFAKFNAHQSYQLYLLVFVAIMSLTFFRTLSTTYTGIRLDGIHSGKLMFTWDMNNCPSITYRISATDGCLSCPNFTSIASTNCTVAGLMNNIRNCTFSVQSEVCGFISDLSDPILITPKGIQLL